MRGLRFRLTAMLPWLRLHLRFFGGGRPWRAPRVQSLPDIDSRRRRDRIENRGEHRRITGYVGRQHLAVAVIDEVEVAYLHLVNALGGARQDLLDVLDHVHG